MKTNMKSTIKNITPDAIRVCIMATLQRFPVTIGYTALFALVAMTFVWHPNLVEGVQQVNILSWPKELCLLLT